MKKKVHPPYQDVLFVDTATGHKFVCGSTLQPKERDTFEGKEYPAFKVAISSSSHPFFTGNQQLIDTEGRVDKFKKKYGAVVKEAPIFAANAELPKAPKAAAKAPVKGAAKAPAKAAAPAKAPAKPAAAEKPKGKK